MEFEVFTLCDYAQNVNGKLTIVGTFDRITNASIPFKHSFSLAARVAGLTGDDNKHLKISIRNKNGEEIVRPIDTDVAVTNGSLSFVVNYDQVEFSSAGTYTVNVLLGTESKSKVITVMQNE